MPRRFRLVLVLLALFPVLAFSTARAQSSAVEALPASLSWNSVEVGQTSAAKLITLTNGQAKALKIAGILLPLGSDFVQSATTCPEPEPPSSAPALAPGQSCTISVIFRPLAPGQRSGMLTVLHDAGAPLQVALSGTAVIGPVLFSPTSISFSSVSVGSDSTPRTVTLTNTSTGSVALSAIAASLGFAQTDNCPTLLAPGANCSLNVIFHPTTNGFTNGAVTVRYNAESGASAQQVYIEASTPLNSVTVSPSSYNYGAVALGDSLDAQFTVSNGLFVPVTIQSVVNSSSAYSIASSTCPSTPSMLPAQSSCSLVVRFNPLAPGSASDTLSIATSSSSSPITATLSGSGQNTGALGFSPGALAWGRVWIGQTSGAKVITVTNPNANAITIGSIAVGSEFVITANTCPLRPSVLPGNSSCAISVAFRPLAQGARADQITIFDSASGNPQIVPLSGTGSVGPLLFSPTSLSFPTTETGQTSAPQVATLTNTTSAAIDMTAITHSNTFPELNNCVPTLAPGASCTFTLDFAPVCGGAKTGTVTVHTANSAVQLYLSGVATGSDTCPPPSTGGSGNTGFSISPGSVFFGNHLVGSQTTRQVLVTNYQTYPISIGSISVSAPFRQTNNCFPTLPEGFSCVVNLTYAPSVAGYSNGALTIVNSAAITPQTIPVTGNAIKPAMAFRSWPSYHSEVTRPVIAK